MSVREQGCVCVHRGGGVCPVRWLMWPANQTLGACLWRTLKCRASMHRSIHMFIIPPATSTQLRVTGVRSEEEHLQHQSRLLLSRR